MELGFEKDSSSDFSLESHELYPVLEEPEYMEEDEETALDVALNNHSSLEDMKGCFAGTMMGREVRDVSTMPLRGAMETMDAIANDFVTCNECFVCHETVFGIQNASYLICPQCYTYFPNSFDRGAFGLAIGIDTQTLMECQADVMAAYEASFLK